LSVACKPPIAYVDQDHLSVEI